MSKITVLDSIMGSGKTEYMLSMLRRSYLDDLQLMLTSDDYAPRNFLIVVPYLDEADRYVAKCPDLRFHQPKQVEGRKLNGLLELIRRGENIVTTHSLFLGMTDAVAEALSYQSYELIVDETPQVINIYDELSRDDMAMLIHRNLLSISKNSGKLTWNMDGDYKGRFDDIRELCRSGYLVNEGKTLFSVYPAKFFKCFDKVMICTYLFEGSVFDAYCRSEGFDVEVLTFDSTGQVVPFDHGASEVERKSDLTGKLSIYKGRMNDIGDKSGKANPLSSGWFGRAQEDQFKALRSSAESFFGRKARTPSKFNGWTTYKAHKAALSGKGYTKGFIAANARATNEYADKAAMAFLCNWFEHPSIVRYFQNKGVEVDQDQIALSVLLQWIWRSRIRNGEPIHLFIPSERMRGLLQDWLKAKPTVEVELVPSTEIDREAA